MMKFIIDELKQNILSIFWSKIILCRRFIQVTRIDCFINYFECIIAKVVFLIIFMTLAPRGAVRLYLTVNAMVVCSIDLGKWLYLTYFYMEASRGAAAQSVTVKPTGCGFDPHSRGWNIYLNFIGVDAKRGVEFCHSTRNASVIRLKVGNGVS